jgi:hypothetical protein
MTADEPRRTNPPATTPEAIVASAELTRQQKIDRLREMSCDARDSELADEEGMGGAVGSDLARIAQALRALCENDKPTEASHQP